MPNDNPIHPLDEFIDKALKKNETIKQKNDLADKFKFVLCSPMGVEVLAHILIHFCRFGMRLAKDQEEIGRYNVGIDILATIGIFDPEKFSIDTIRRLVGG